MAVDIKNLDICIAEATRFLKKAKACCDNLLITDRMNRTRKKDKESFMFPDIRLSAAVRRSSMDLTRALAALRDYRR